jgi:uncharacterized membrane protein YgdD (TMEM256/DUF423 family)
MKIISKGQKMKDTKLWIIIAGISGFTAVAFGAFGAHELSKTLSPDMIEVYKTGVLYQLVHSAVLLALALFSGKKFRSCKMFFLAGIILFSFSLYLYAVTGLVVYAYITPFGGISFLIGWLLVIINGVKLSKDTEIK